MIRTVASPFPLRPLIVLVFVALVLTGTVQAQNRYFVGARNLGMGNTGVASTTDAMSVHFNPAALAFARGWEVQLPLVTVDAEVEGDLFEKIDAIEDTFDGTTLRAIQERLNDGTGSLDDLERVLNAYLYQIKDLSLTSRNGGFVRGSAGPVGRWKNWGFALTALGNGGVDSMIDLENGLSLSSGGLTNAIPANPDACMSDPTCLEIAARVIDASGGSLDQARAETLVAAAGAALADDAAAEALLLKIVDATASGDGILADNETGLLTTQLGVVQFTASYGHMLIEDKLSVGGSLNVMGGEVSRSATLVAELDTGRNTLEDALSGVFRQEVRSSTEISIDLAARYKISDRWAVGLVGNNLNSPEFTLEDAAAFELEAQFRGGVEYRPLRWFNVTADLDLNRIDANLLRELEYQYLNVGAEFLAGKVFSGWLGGYRNLAAENASNIFTAGVGLRFGRFQVGLSGAVADSRVQVNTGEDAKRYPDGAAASITLAYLPKRER